MKHSQSDALVELLSPDGYYRYLDVPKSSSSVGDSSTDGEENSPLKENAIDADLVKKNYRKLSLKHHPDRPGGDADTFRLLNRAQKVLLDPKLRHQYDLLGIDLDDDEAEHDEATVLKDSETERPSTSQGIITEIAGMMLTSLVQLTVRTGTSAVALTSFWSLLIPLCHTVMMGIASCLIARFCITLYLALAFMVFMAFRIYQNASRTGGSFFDLMSPVLIASGLFLMFRGRTSNGGWSKLFWCGESFVLYIFVFNSVGPVLPKTPVILGAIVTFSVLMSLWFRGRVWNYAIVVGLEVFLVLFVLLAGPAVEFVLETILNEKLRKIGDKVRAHHVTIEKYYKAKLELSKGSPSKQRK